MKAVLFCILFAHFLAGCTGEPDILTQKQQRLKSLLKENSDCGKVRSVSYSLTNGTDSAHAEIRGCESASFRAEAERLNAAIARALPDNEKICLITITFAKKDGSETFEYRGGKLFGFKRTEQLTD